MQKRSEIWAEKDTKELIKKYRKDLKSDKRKVSLASRYGLALALKKDKKYEESFKILRELNQRKPK